MKRFFTIAVLLVIGFCLYATGVDDLVLAAMENSQTMKTLEINRQNTELSWRSQDLDEDKVSVTLSTGNITVQKESTGNPVFSMGPSVDVTMPETDNGTTLSFGLDNTTRIYTSGNSTVTLTPNANLTRKISIDSYTDSREDLTRLKNRAQQNLSYQKSLLQFRGNVIQSVISIIQAKVSLDSAQLSYERDLADYENDLASGSITEGSLKDLQRQMKNENARISLESKASRYQSLLDSFRQNYGIDYETPDEIGEADLTLDISEEGNTTVLIAGYSLAIARQELEVASGTSRNVVLGASADTPFTYTGTTTDNIWKFGINGSVSASMSASNYSFGAKAGAGYEYNYNTSTGEFIPYITITGKWTNDTTSEKDDLEIQTLRNKVILAQMDYDDALESYFSDARDIEQKIADLNTEVSQFETNARYNELILERTLQMYESGLSTMRDVQDARNEVADDAVQRMIYALQALLIENEIALLQL